MTEYQEKVERWAKVWASPDHDADAIFAHARKHDGMKACLAGLLRSRSAREPLPLADVELSDRIGDEVFDGRKR